MSRVRLIGTSKRKRGLGVIERQGQEIKSLQRAPQGIEGIAESRSSVVIVIKGKRYRITATQLE
jgi:hypothetical protein